MSKVIRFFFLLLAGVLAACSSGPQRTYSAGDELAVYDFSEARTFEEGAYPDATLRIADDVYRITLNRGDSEVWWAQWGDTLANVVVEVEVEQISESNENAYGIACRLQGAVGQDVAVDPELAAIASGEATEEPDAETTAEVDEGEDETSDETQLANGDGYLFLIQGNGRYAILRSRRRSITPLVNWTQSDKINQGPGQNELRAVCMDDYLALYVNGEFVADTTDTTYETGQVGVAATASNRLGVEVEFDNLTVHEAESS